MRNFSKSVVPLIKGSAIIFLGLYFSLIQFTISYPYIHLFPIPTPAILTLAMSFLFFLFWYVSKEKQVEGLRTDVSVKFFVLLFVLSILLSLLSSLYTGSVILSIEYQGYLKRSLITRLLYYSTFLALVYFGYYTLKKLGPKQSLNILKTYPLSILLLIIIGIWQLLYFLYGIPFLDIETRSYIHSVSKLTFFNFRLTSFADEPSYLGPIIIDMLILGILVFKRKWIYGLVFAIPGIVVLLFSFSVSAYMNILFLGAFIVIYLIFHPIFPKKYLLFFLGIVAIGILSVILVKPTIFETFFSPILGRVGNLFDVQSSSRIYMYLMPIYWLLDHSIISALFGYGPGSFEFLSSTKILPNTGTVSASSNNMYIDLLFENGIIGFGLILIALIALFVKLLKKGRENIFYFVALLEYVHLLITSTYRADFVTPRFWGVLLIIFVLMKCGELLKGKNSFDGVS